MTTTSTTGGTVDDAYVRRTCFGAPLLLLTSSGSAPQPFDSMQGGKSIPPLEARCVLPTPALLEAFTAEDVMAWSRLATQEIITRTVLVGGAQTTDPADAPTRYRIQGRK